MRNPAPKASSSSPGVDALSHADAARAIRQPLDKEGACIEDDVLAQIIAKGMIYSPAHGDIAFTVPMFDAYVARSHPGLPQRGDFGLPQRGESGPVASPPARR